MDPRLKATKEEYQRRQAVLNSDNAKFIRRWSDKRLNDEIVKAREAKEAEPGRITGGWHQLLLAEAGRRVARDLESKGLTVAPDGQTVIPASCPTSKPTCGADYAAPGNFRWNDHGDPADEEGTVGHPPPPPTLPIHDPSGPVPIPPRPIYEIASEIKRKWQTVYFGAVPYLDAMMYLKDRSSKVGMDDAKSVILYFLGNAKTWRGDDAKRIKAELKQIAGLK